VNARLHRGRCLRPALAALVAAALAGCSEPAPPPAPARPVYVSPVQAAEGPASRQFTATVQARVEATLAFRTGGQVAARLVDVGARVRAGQPLARLDASDVLLAVQAAEDQVRAARVDAEQAASDAARFGRLAAEGSVGGADRERQQARADAAAARLDQAQRQLALARSRFSYTSLQAPYDGVVTALLAEQGQVVAEGQPVLTLARDGQREVVTDIPEDWVAHVRGADATAIAFSLVPDNDGARAVPLRLRELAPAASAQGRTFRARFAAMPGAADTLHRWPLGSTARLQLALRDGGERGVRVPVSAVVKGDGAAGVWVIGATGRTLVFQPVQVLGIEESALRVSGLAPGQRVVSVGAEKLDAGMTVRPVERPGAEPTARPARSGP